jgi:hypothetical protein
MNPYILRAMEVSEVLNSSKAKAALEVLVKRVMANPEYLELVERYKLNSEQDNLLKACIERE